MKATTNNRLMKGATHSISKVNHTAFRMLLMMILICGSIGAWGNSYAKLTVKANNDSYGTVTGGGTSSKSANGSNASFTVTAEAKYGCRFVKWEFTSGSGTINNETSSSTTVTVKRATKNNETANYTVQAVFEEIPKSTFYYSIQAAISSGSPATSGTVTPSSAYTGSVETIESSGSAKYTVTAVANTGYEFVGWSTADNETSYISGAGASYEYTINNINGTSNTSPNPQVKLYAHFRELPSVYFKATAVAVPTEGGTVSASVTNESKRASSSTNPSATTSATYTVTSTADGYYFIGWSDTEGGEIKSTATSYTKTITATSTSSSSPTETKAYANFKTEPTGITVSPTSMELGVGGTKKITVTLSPSGAYEKITYSSDKPGVATVAADGTVTGVAAGTATITVQAKTSGGSAPEKLRKTVSVTVKEQVATPVISFTPIDDGATATATITCATEGAVIYYTINSDDPTPTTSAKKKDTKTLTSPQGTTKYENPFTVDANDVVKTIAVKSGNYINSLVATLMYSPKKVPTPTINMAKGQVTFSCEEPGVTYYYTIDGTTTPAVSETAPYYKWNGTTPVTGVNEKNIQVIAVKSGFSNSAVASKLYIAGSGVSGTTVILNDYEDHTWTYYSDKPDTDYPNVLRSPDPRNVKIIYTGGAVSGASAVAVSATESQNTFIYYETIEKNAWGSDKGRWLTGDYAYRTIRNPFSKRPKNGTTYYGFNGWKIISGGKYIGKTDGTTVAADELVNFQNFSSTDPNATAAVIEFEAQWAVAEMKTSTNGTMPSFSKSSYELNLWVITGNSSVTIGAPGKPVTVMGCYPDGSSAGTATIGSATSGTNAANILKIENIKIGNGTASVHPYEPNTPGITNDAGSGTFTVQNGALIVGRGCVGTVATVQSGNSGRQYYLCMESGKYRYVNPMSSGSNNEDGWGRIVFGCDYDRASDDGHDNNGTGDNSKLRVVSYISWSSNGTGKASGSTSEWMDITVKSGYFGYCHNTTTYSTSKPEGRGLAIGGNSDNAIEYKTLDVDNQTYFTLTQNDLRGSTVADKTNSLYCGGSRSYAKGGVIRVLIEGGELNSINGGSYNNASKGVMAANFRVKGGWIKGALYGTASSSVTDANTRLVVTGGEINGWIAGACNGTDFQGTSWVKGNNNGSTYLYIGGNAECRSHNKDGKYNNAWGLIGGVQGGNIFASGRGGNPADFGAAVGSTNYNACSYCGSSIDTYLVVADKCQVEQAVYGGGYLGIAQQSHIWITGGTMGAVYGGASAPITTNTDWRAKSTDIRMYGGLVKNGVYGGHYLGSDNAGAIHGNSSVAIYGGQVGTDVTHTGNVYGGGMGDGTEVKENVTVTLGQLDSEGEPVKGVLKIFGNVYGGSALGQTNTSSTSNTTTVTVNSGIVSGNVFGGGMGELTGTGRDATPVAGHGTVNGTISVTVNGTDETGTGYSGPGKYAIGGVFGGCDMIAYNGIPAVTINNCESSIRYVYGGGNASNVKGTNVTINAGDIDYAFGGGNGADTTKPGANINGNAVLNILGGTINNIFGGSNTLGDVTGTATVTLNDGNDECPITAQEVYGGANEAPMTGTPQLNLVCLKNRLEKVYGGSRAVDVAMSVVLNITGGEYGQVFGGNNVSGNIKGSITVNIDETGCSPIKIDELYCGGDKAHYSVYGYNTDGTPKTSGDKYDDPTINVISCTRIGKVFGGGYGNSAVVYGDPHVNINLINGAHSASVTNRWNNKLGTIGDVYGGGNAAKVVGDTYVNIGTKSTVLRADGTTKAGVLGVNISGNIYGGGNAADVTGKTNVTVGK